jgi:hypothetical protein
MRLQQRDRSNLPVYKYLMVSGLSRLLQASPVQYSVEVRRIYLRLRTCTCVLKRAAVMALLCAEIVNFGDCRCCNCIACWLP